MSRLSRSVVIALAAGSLIAAPFGAPASGQPAWSIESSPNATATQHNFLNDVTCLSATECWSAGYYRADAAYQAIVQRWDGSAWSLVPSLDTSAERDEFVQSIACPSPGSCWITGFAWSRTDSAYQPLLSHWDGQAWSDVPASNSTLPESAFLYDITCPSATECWAVGQHQVDILGGGFGPRQSLIVHWDGESWSTVPSPNTLPARSNTLLSVTCSAPSECWAVGSHAGAAAEQTLIQRWDGQSWSIVSSPSTDPAEQNFLNGVSCLSPDSCWAVGVHTSGVNQTLIQHWDGQAWSIVASPNTDPGLANVLFSVSCISETECWTAGYHKEGNPLRTLLLRWDGESWSITGSPNSAPGRTNTFRAVTCETASCWAVGNHYNAQGLSKTLITRYGVAAIEPVSTTLGLTLETARDEVIATSTLRTADGAALAGKEIVFLVNGIELARAATDVDGIASATFGRSEVKPHDTIEVRFLGDEGLAPSQASATLKD